MLSMRDGGPAFGYTMVRNSSFQCMFLKDLFALREVDCSVATYFCI